MKAGFGERVLRAAAAIPAGPRPRTAVVLGSGLSGIAAALVAFGAVWHSAARARRNRFLAKALVAEVWWAGNVTGRISAGSRRR